MLYTTVNPLISLNFAHCSELRTAFSIMCTFRFVGDFINLFVIFQVSHNLFFLAMTISRNYRLILPFEAGIDDISMAVFI
jgi:hypothetical protein